MGVSRDGSYLLGPSCGYNKNGESVSVGTAGKVTKKRKRYKNRVDE